MVDTTGEGLPTFIVKLMAKPPAVHESAPPNIPARAAGTTPAVALRPDALATE